MTLLDFLLLALLLTGMARGFFKGFVVEIFSLLALVLGVAICLHISPGMVSAFRDWAGGSVWLSYLLYIVVFLVVYGLVFLMGKVLEQLLKLTGLNIFNRIAGVIFSGIKVMFILSIICWVTVQFELMPEPTASGSLFFPYLVRFSPWLLEELARFLPFLEGLVHQTETYLERILLEINDKDGI